MWSIVEMSPAGLDGSPPPKKTLVQVVLAKVVSKFRPLRKVVRPKISVFRKRVRSAEI